jgi:hypothetical protein
MATRYHLTIQLLLCRVNQRAQVKWPIGFDKSWTNQEQTFNISELINSPRSLFVLFALAMSGAVTRGGFAMASHRP